MQTTRISSNKEATLKSSPSKNNVGITKADVEAALKKWGNSLVAISKASRNGEDYKKLAEVVIKNNYNYQNGPVLFKPTLASQITFRTTFEGALSYFVGDNSSFPEDRGFALNHWENVDFKIAGVIIEGTQAIVMGNKLLKDNTGKITIANFTMGFVRDHENNLKINLHHSSLPFMPN